MNEIDKAKQGQRRETGDDDEKQEGAAISTPARKEPIQLEPRGISGEK